MRLIILIFNLSISFISYANYEVDDCHIKRNDRLNFKIGPGLHCYEKQIVADMLETLESFTFEHMNSQVASILGLKGNNAADYINYLENRVGIIVGDARYNIGIEYDFEMGSKKQGSFPGFFPQQGPGLMTGKTIIDADCAGCVEAVFHSSLGFKTRISVKDYLDEVIEGANSKVINLNTGFFYPVKMPDERNAYSKINQIMRIAIFFHEARHHDGKAQKMGFLHHPCSLENSNQSCDYEQDGPFWLELNVLDALLKECNDCEENHEAMNKMDRMILHFKTRIVQKSEAKKVAEKLLEKCESAGFSEESYLPKEKYFRDSVAFYNKMQQMAPGSKLMPSLKEDGHCFLNNDDELQCVTANMYVYNALDLERIDLNLKYKDVCKEMTYLKFLDLKKFRSDS